MIVDKEFGEQQVEVYHRCLGAVVFFQPKPLLSTAAQICCTTPF